MVCGASLGHTHLAPVPDHTWSQCMGPIWAGLGSGMQGWPGAGTTCNKCPRWAPCTACNMQGWSQHVLCVVRWSVNRLNNGTPGPRCPCLNSRSSVIIAALRISTSCYCSTDTQWRGQVLAGEQCRAMAQSGQLGSSLIPCLFDWNPKLPLGFHLR